MSTDANPRFMSVKEVAHLLGKSVEGTYRLFRVSPPEKDGGPPRRKAGKDGRSLLIPRQKFLRWAGLDE